MYVIFHTKLKQLIFNMCLCVDVGCHVDISEALLPLS